MLVRHGVAFVLVGGAAIQSHGGSHDTQDIDLAPETGDANLQRLCDALNELNCQLVTDLANTAAWLTLPDDYFTPRSIRAASVWNLATRHGQLDLTFAPSAFPTGYDELRKRTDPRAGRRDDRHSARRRTRGCPPFKTGCESTQGSGVLSNLGRRCLTRPAARPEHPLSDL